MSPAAPALRKLRSDAACLAIAFMAALSCSDAGNGARTSEPRAPDRWSIDKAGGNVDLQRDTVLSMIAQLAVLVHMNDRPAGGATVTWRVSLDTGVVMTSPTTTDLAGMATFQFILGPTVGNYTVEASLDSAVSNAARVSFSVIATPGHATTLAIESGAGQTDTATAQLQADYVVRLTDAHGNGIPGMGISWVVTSGAGSITPATTLTLDPTGQARARHTLGRIAGSNSVSATMPGLEPPVVFNATAMAAHPTRLTMVSGNNQVAPINNALGADDVVRVTDAYGNAVTGVEVDWTIISGGGSLSTTKSTTIADGSATVRSTLGSAGGTQTVAATASDLPGAPRVVFSATAMTPSPPPPPPPPPPPSATGLVLVSGDKQTGYAGGQLSDPITVKAIDAAGHGVPNQQIAFAVTSGGGNLYSTLATTDAQGFATTWWTLGLVAGAQTMTAKAAFTSTVIVFTATVGLTPLVITTDPSGYSYYGLDPRIGIGQYFDAWVGPANFVAVSAPLVVTLSHAGTARASVPATVTIPAGGAFVPFRITGTSVGTDQLTASAPGYGPASLGLTVDLGTIDFGLITYYTGPLTVGGSTSAYVCSSGPADNYTVVAAPTTFSLSSSANIRFAADTAPGTVITSVTVPADNSCASFLVQGIAAGAATINITNSNYKPFAGSITVNP